LHAQPPVFHQHIGLYAYRREFLLRLSAMPRAPLEEMESLEQLRALHSGYTILVGVVDEPTVGIDTEKDYRAFVRRVVSC
jgi:3-deoxy-manno-octulosonate cytidylyltransferase (CMP-KDO synthetase)